MAAPAAVLSILLTANTKGASTGILRVNQQLDATQAKANKAGRALGSFAKIASVGVAVGIGYAVKKAADFEQQLDSLGSVAGATARQMETLRKQAMKAGADTKFSALEAAKAQTELAKGGLKVKQILDGGLNASLALAAAGEMDLADAASTTANALNLFGLKGKGAMKVADMLATAANATTADVSDFALALQQGGSVAKSAGLSFKETVLALEALAKSGIKGSDAGTSLKTSMIQLIKPTAKQKELADKLNLSFVDQKGNFKDLGDISTMLRNRLGDLTKTQRTATLAQLAGTDGVRTLTALYDAGQPRLDNWAKGLAKQGTAAEVAAKKQDNFKGKLENLKGSIETTAIAIGSKMLPSLTKAAEKLTDIINDPKLTGAEKFDQFAKMAGDAFAKAIPIIADKAAQAAPVVAKAFVTGFLSAGVWGRLAIAGFLLKQMGGVPAFMKVGQQAGAATGAGMASGVAASGLKGKLVGLMGSWGPALGVALGVALAPEVVKALKEINPSTETRGEDKFKTLRDGAKSFDQLTAAVHKTNAEFDANETASAGLNPALKRVQGSVQQVQDAFNKTAEPVRRVERLIENMATGSSSSVASMRAKVKLNTVRIRKALGDDTAAGKDALTKNFLAAADNVRRSMAAGTIATKAGTALIEQYMVKALQGMGFSKKAAVNLRNRAPGSTQTPGPNDEMIPHARGGHIAGGKPTGDSIPALLERGEYVLNRKAVAKVGRRSLDQLNYAAAPRFQQGGQIGRTVVDGPSSMLKSTVQGALDTTTAAANAKIAAAAAAAAASGPGGGKPGPGGVGTYKGVTMANWVIQALQYASRKGVNPQPTSGYRSHATNVAHGRMYFSEHEGTKYPHGAVDFGGFTSGLVPKMAVVAATADFRHPLLAPQGFRDDGHASGTGHQRGGLIGLQKGGLLAGLNRVFPASSLARRGASITERQVRAVAEKWGGLNPARALQAAQIARGESAGFHPGIIGYDPGGTLGIGLWQITRGVQGALGKSWIDHRGGDVGMRNPKKNAEVMSLLSGNGRNWGNWRGTAFLKPLQKGVASVFAGAGGRVSGPKSGFLSPGFLKRVKGAGLPGGVQGNLNRYSHTAAVAADMADRASQLSTDDALGVVGGKTQAQWLQQQLEALFKYRNALIRAEEIVVERRKAMAALLVKAHKQLTELRKHPKANRAAITRLKNTIIPGLEGKRSNLNTLRGTLLSNLEEVQGIGSPMSRLKHLPALGVLGGTILGVQTALRDLNAPKSSVTDSEGSSALAELLTQANLRTAVSQAQYKIFRDFPQFAAGGVVPGARGQAVPVIAHAGEGIFRPDQMAAMGGAGANVTINIAPGMEWLKKFISVEVEQGTRRMARSGSRGLPGRGGGV